MTNNELTIMFIQTVVTAIAAIVASSGFWLYISHIKERKDLTRQLLIGLAHDRIVCLATEYISRGYITQDEYDNLRTFLFEPYKKMGENGYVERLMKEVDNLPFFNKALHNDIRNRIIDDEIKKAKKGVLNDSI